MTVVTAPMRLVAPNSQVCRRAAKSAAAAVSSFSPTLPSLINDTRNLCQGGSVSFSLDNHHQNHAFRTIHATRAVSKDAKVSSSTNQAPDDKHVVFQALDGENARVATLMFNRPNAANAMGRTMLSQLQSQIAHLSHQKSDVRCVVLTSATSKVFSAGADLRERSKMSQEEAAEFVSSLRSTFDAMANLPMPIISAVEGVAVGGGLEIALTSDIIVAGENAKFGLPETSLAIIPGAGGTQRLPRLIGVARAKELIFTARRIDARTAHEYGLVQHVVAAGDAQVKALEIAREIAANGPLAIRAAKSSVLQGMDAPSLSDAMEIERTFYQTIIPTEDRLEGLAAFREKRKPEYNGE